MRSVALSFGFILAWLSGGIAFGQCNAKSCSDSNVELLYFQSNGDILIELSGDTSPLNCARVSDVFVTLKSTHGNKQEIVATLLSAQNAEKPVTRVRIVENSAGCDISYVSQAAH